VVVSDAFAYVHTCSEQFDYVAVDLFRGERLIQRAFGKPFLRRLRSILSPRGHLAVNLFRDTRESPRIERIATFFDVRERVVVGGNVVVHAVKRRA
jgi:spermidine synthase